MKNALRVGVVSVAVGLLGVGCAPTVCERAAALNAKRGNCGAAIGNPLGVASSCSTRLAVCSAAEQQVVTDALGCLEKLSTCDFNTEGDYLAQQSVCLSPLLALGYGG